MSKQDTVIITQPAPKRADSLKNAIICAIAGLLLWALYGLAQQGVFN
jgi:hypothetical protein